MMITASDLIKKSAKEYIGKTVYFFDEHRHPIKGVIEGFDDYQFFVSKRYGLIYGKSEFFFSLEDMFTWIKENLTTAST